MHYLEMHRRLLADKGAQSRFRRAIRLAVAPGDVVLDLGTGSGIHAMFACQAGAKKVYAIDLSAVIEIARIVVKENGYSDRIEFIPGRSSEVRLPQKVDLIMTHMGFLGTLNNLIDGRKRFLKNGGKIIPESVSFSFSLVEDPGQYGSELDFWSRRHYGFGFDPFQEVVSNCPREAVFAKNRFLAQAVETRRVEILKLPAPELHWDLDFRIKRSGTLCGIAVWYSYQLFGNITLDAAPSLDLDPSLWSCLFLPIGQGIKVAKGQRVAARIGFFFGPQISGGPIWKWDVEVDGRHFQHSSFKTTPISRESLEKRRGKKAFIS